MSPGSVTERMAFFTGSYRAGERVSEGGGVAGEGEDIEIVEVTLAEAIAMVERGEIVDAQDRAAAAPRSGADRIASRDVTAPETPFADAVDAFLREAPTAFSTPGHKRNPALIGDDPLLAGDAPWHGGADDLRGSRGSGRRPSGSPQRRSAPTSAASPATARRIPTRRSASRSRPRASR